MKKQRFLAAVLCAALLSAALAGCSQGDSAEAEGLLLRAQVELPEELTLEDIRTAEFADIPADGQDYDTVCYAAYHGILQGKSNGLFAPDEPVNRAVVVTVLHRMCGEKAAAASGYSDVPEDSWCADAVAWATEAGITTGTTADTFSPNALVTRAQLAVLLQRFAAYCGMDTAADGQLSGCADGDSVPAYAAQPLAWVLEKDLYRTMVSDTILPSMPVSRIQLAQALVGLSSLSGDALAGEIFAALPQKTATSDLLPQHDQIQAAVNAAAEKYGAIGLQVAVVENGAVTDTYAYGWATKDTDPMTADHKLRVASISKVAVGLSAMILKEEGTVSLDAGIGNYWGFPVKNPAYPDKPITLRSMLMHTSSIINAGDDVSRSYSSVRSRLRQGGFSKAVPGSIGYWSYNNYAYGVLGMTLELASGRYVDDILQQRLFDAMEIDGSFAPGTLDDPQRIATLYRNGGAVARSAAEQRTRGRWETPGATGTYFAGGLTISARDLGKLAALLSQDGRYEGVQLLRAASVAEMEAYDPSPVPGGSYQGLTLRYHQNIYGREGVYYHTGSAYGVYNCFSYDPVTGDGVVVLTTGASGAKDDFGIYKVCAEINDTIYRALA